jgi:RNA polymerase sigma factor (sigma-70 family)
MLHPSDPRPAPWPADASHSDTEVAALVRAGAAGDQVALARLVMRFDSALRAVARSYRLSPWDTDDVIQSTWLQFMQHGRDLRRPLAIRGWLVTTARRQSLQLLRQCARERPTDDPAGGRRSPESEPEPALLAREQCRVLQAALADLPGRERTLMDLLMARPDLSYAQVGRLLAMPIGSIGPTRARSLARLRRNNQIRALQAASA